MSGERFSLSRLIDFLRERKSLAPILLALLLGVGLMLLGGSGAVALPTSASVRDSVELEGRICELCERVAGVTGVEVMVTLEAESGEVGGIAIVCVGGDDALVQLKLTRMLGSLFGIGADRIGIIGAGG